VGLPKRILPFVMRLLIAVVLLTTVVESQELKPDSLRDEAIREHLQDFVTGSATIKELEASLRQFASQFEAAPYKMRWATPEQPYVDMIAIPEEQLKSIVILIARLTLPIQNAYFSGQLSAPEAAKKLVPFFFIFPGYGIDPPPNADAVWHQRREELLRQITEFARR
jgi:hypothetical protein